MKALILKDAYVMWKQMRIAVILVLLFSAIPNTFNNVFAVIYATMIPYSALAYDERSKWDQLAAMMPYSPWDIVLGKYVLGWLCIAGSAVISLLLQTVLRRTVESFTLLGVSVCIALCILSVTLPLMFRFGVEKGRALTFFITFLVCGSAGAVAGIASYDSGAQFVFQGPILLLLPIAAVVLTAVSVPLSVKLRQTRMN